MSDVRGYPDYRPLIRDIKLDGATSTVSVVIRDPVKFATSSISPQYVDPEEFRACCAEIDSQLRTAGVFDVFGPETSVQLVSEVFSLREDCGHIGSDDICPFCSSLPSD